MQVKINFRTKKLCVNTELKSILKGEEHIKDALQTHFRVWVCFSVLSLEVFFFFCRRLRVWFLVCKSYCI